MRLFVAVHPSAEAVEHLRQAVPAGLRLTAVAGWHLTLAFLGEVPDAQPIEAALGEVAGREPFDLWLSGAGGFETAVWAGVAGEVGVLAGLRQDICAALKIEDDRPFRPHLTIAYLRDRKSPPGLDRARPTSVVPDSAGPARAGPDSNRQESEGGGSKGDESARADHVIRGLKDYTGPPWTVTSFALVRSHHHTGGGYERLAEWG